MSSLLVFSAQRRDVRLQLSTKASALLIDKVDNAGAADLRPTESNGALLTVENSDLYRANNMEPSFWDFFRPSSDDHVQIDLHSILDAYQQDNLIVIRYAGRSWSRSHIKPRVKTFVAIEGEPTKEFISSLLNLAYGDSIYKKNILILMNPFSGRGKAKENFAEKALPLLEAASATVTIIETTHSGHALEIAQDLKLDQYDALVCCSGDGLIHEVFNGFATRKDAAAAYRTPVCLLPGGTGNALSQCFQGSGLFSYAALSIIKGIITPVDMCSITQGTKRTVSFLSQAVGLVAECDLATEDLRWLGYFRVIVGFFKRILFKDCYPLTLYYDLEEDNKDVIKSMSEGSETSTWTRKKLEDLDSLGMPPLDYGYCNEPPPSNWKMEEHPKLGTLYAGCLPWMATDLCFFPAACHVDGLIDLLLVETTCPIFDAIKMMIKAETGKHFDMKHVRYMKVKAYRVVPKAKSGYLSIDGESYPFKPYQVEVHRGLATVLADKYSLSRQYL